MEPWLGITKSASASHSAREGCAAIRALTVGSPSPRSTALLRRSSSLQSTTICRHSSPSLRPIKGISTTTPNPIPSTCSLMVSKI